MLNLLFKMSASNYAHPSCGEGDWPPALMGQAAVLSRRKLAAHRYLPHTNRAAGKYLEKKKLKKSLSKYLANVQSYEWEKIYFWSSLKNSDPLQGSGCKGWGCIPAPPLQSIAFIVVHFSAVSYHVWLSSTFKIVLLTFNPQQKHWFSI